MTGEVVHRLGAVVGTVLAAAWLARTLGAVRRERTVRRRLTGLLASEPARLRPRYARTWATARGWLPLLGAVGAGWALVGGFAGVAAGLVGAAALRWWRSRREATGVAADRAGAAEAARQLPLAADLLAACIAAGASPVAAARAVGEALGGPVGEALGRGAAEVRLGGEPDGAWSGLSAVPGAGPLARLLERADVSGLPAAGPAARLAAQARADWARTTTARARRAAVMVTAPVGLCFLPAFIAVGVLPVVIGLAAGALGDGGGGG
ncbi:type II secretion system F family protein [Streptomyces olivaceus]|uniref:type II secretion system F family protein n=1 Tax=Streptomyces TaxID=1883 RepID=UPI0018A86BD9|nr:MULTISPECIES: type II secretion system F family protein [Streptomyces]MBF8173487.1 type II secretion system F family protein [Streptomyces olivaceus]MBZ6254117.1 type II secretion system F family protein [Streptomyces olivaceus]MCU8593581.1 type II secretion system F family protein [Streptomyces sp. A13(2022)]WFB87977.1 type II secretion system F family protein [Streptomyces olivaceus]WGK47580.1 type II secretion system F family protein [Streptomyces sp. B146]